jgi:hypothetical protein
MRQPASELRMNKTIMRQPTIRPGQRKPYAKATRQQIDERTQAAALLLHLGLAKTEIHRLSREKFGVEWRRVSPAPPPGYTWRSCARARVSASVCVPKEKVAFCAVERAISGNLCTACPSDLHA